MKYVKRISLFMAMSMFMLGLGGWGALKAEEFFYPHRFRLETDQAETEGDSGFRQSISQLANVAGLSDEDNREEAEQELEAAQEEQVIETAAADYAAVTADTRYLVEQVDLSKGTVKESEETIPVMYIGLSREELLEALSAYEDNPPLSELEQGFESIELTAFSKDRIAVCKYYRQQEPHGFYLMVADHFIVVYEEDRSTLYMNTDILLERLPDSLQGEIMAGKFVASEEELYLFLESYSS